VQMSRALHIKKTRTVSETETHRVVILRSRPMQMYCPGCGRNVEMVMLEGAAAGFAMNMLSAGERALASGHCMQSSGVLWVCWEWISQGRTPFRDTHPPAASV
jgi:hypothetical protein